MHQHAFIQLEFNIAPWHVSLESTYISILSSHLWTTCFIFLKAHHIAFEIPQIFWWMKTKPIQTTRMASKWTTKFNFDKTKTAKLVWWANHEWNHIFLHLCSHTKLNSCNVKHIATILHSPLIWISLPIVQHSNLQMWPSHWPWNDKHFQ